MVSCQKFRMTQKYFFLAILLSFSVTSVVSVAQDAESQPSGQEVAQAQATMASLFGRGATMPSAPRMSGTIALPPFDSSGIEVDEKSLNEAQQQVPGARD
jgi:hypothetical protein